MYDIVSSDAFTSSDSTKNHIAPINQVQFSKDARIFASASKDGSIKIWDAVEFSCIRTIDHAHSGESVETIQFSSDGKHILTSGQDKQARVWEVASGKELLTIGSEEKGKFKIDARFTYGDEFILSAMEPSSEISIFSSKTGELVHQLEGHSSIIRSLCVSPFEDSFISCSDDSKARFWSL